MTPGAAPERVSPGEPEEQEGTIIKTLYLVRHGEALHNIEEKKAKQCAEAEAEAQGFERGSLAFRAMTETARKSVLKDDQLKDASLSESGKEEACQAKAEIERLTAGKDGLPAPTGIYVSPLQRTLQTASIIFPGHPGTHIREFLRERRTGLPCDERQPASALAKRASFVYMSHGGLAAFDTQDHCAVTEDSCKLRERTAVLAGVLRGMKDDVLCVVTHKGFLRELERGPFNRPDATEFRNCEVRVYDVELGAGDELVATLRHGDGRSLTSAEASCAKAQRDLAAARLQQGSTVSLACQGAEAAVAAEDRHATCLDEPSKE
eukprot:CAMPEP_0197884042 /NCGR_PEP_ID=MMETSP1439-20131203/10647_1 /TAXON_ID=66791 /ORGANISM="Gonyaulax spinifera, Strain CCMP409" /LENGTH=320 /DNA_ID=CAMNT_0043503771 /DNA_START=17 /DNA_END=977 /DNA_ORIENTATION=+